MNRRDLFTSAAALATPPMAGMTLWLGAGDSTQGGRSVHPLDGASNNPDRFDYDIVWIGGQSNGYVEVEMVGQHHSSGNKWAQMDRDGVVTTGTYE